jgi:hypothetical protein
MGNYSQRYLDHLFFLAQALEMPNIPLFFGVLRNPCFYDHCHGHICFDASQAGSSLHFLGIGIFSAQQVPVN